VTKGSLFDYLHIYKKKLSDYDQLSIAYDLAVSLQYLHSRKIYHCDLKSSNVLLDEMKVKLTDFGLSSLVNFKSDICKGRIGTPHWMAPEIMLGEKYSIPSDIYSYGMILWEMLTNQIPYYGLAIYQIIGVVTECKKPLEIPDYGNNDLKNVIRNCIFYEREKRPQLLHIIKYLGQAKKKYISHDQVSEEISYFLQ
jgi:serine/threonine protein kinase